MKQKLHPCRLDLVLKRRSNQMNDRQLSIFVYVHFVFHIHTLRYAIIFKPFSK